MHTSDACGPFKRTHTLVQNEGYTKIHSKDTLGESKYCCLKRGSGRRMDLVGQNEREIFKDAYWLESYVLQVQACYTGHNAPKLLHNSPSTLLLYLHQFGIQILHLKYYNHNISNLLKFLLFSLLSLNQLHL